MYLFFPIDFPPPHKNIGFEKKKNVFSAWLIYITFWEMRWMQYTHKHNEINYINNISYIYI